MSSPEATPTKSEGYDDEFESDGSPTKTKEEDASPTKTEQSTPPRSPTPKSDSAPASPQKQDSKEVDSPTKDEEEKHEAASTPSKKDDESSAKPSPTKSEDEEKADSRNASKNEDEEKADSRNASKNEDSSPAAADDHQEEHQQKDDDAADEKAADPNPEEQQDENKSTSPSKQTKFAQRKRLPPHSSAVASVTYPGERQIAVAEILDPSKPLVKSTKPLTKPLGPTFVEETTAEERRQKRLQHKAASLEHSNVISDQRNNERKYLKAQQEFEREKRLAERSIYHRERVSQWSSRLAASPLGVDLVADHERIDEEAFVRMREEKRRQTLAERRKRRIKNEIIVKALAEVPLLEEARRQKREMLVEERREKALRDVQRVEAIQARKLRDMALMREERQAKLDQRLMNT